VVSSLVTALINGIEHLEDLYYKTLRNLVDGRGSLRTKNCQEDYFHVTVRICRLQKDTSGTVSGCGSGSVISY